MQVPASIGLMATNTLATAAQRTLQLTDNLLIALEASPEAVQTLMRIQV
jgi:hypothetical protein